MSNINEVNIALLMGKPVWQMTGEEFCALTRFAVNQKDSGQVEDHAYAYGIKELYSILGCSESTINSLKKAGILETAIISQIGRRIIFDVGKARTLANEYQQNRRKTRHQESSGKQD